MARRCRFLQINFMDCCNSKSNFTIHAEHIAVYCGYTGKHRAGGSSMKTDYMDASFSPRQRAEALLQELTLDEKMAQINCIFPFDKMYLDYESIAQSVPDGIGEVSTLEMRRIETLEEAAAWQRRVQGIIMENSPHHIPAIFHIEGLCGAFILT